MTLNNDPGAYNRKDPESDIYSETFHESGTDDVEGIIVPSGGMNPGSIWYVRVCFGTVDQASMDFNEGYLSITDGSQYSVDPPDDQVVAWKLIEDDEVASNNCLETYVKAEEVSGSIGVAVYFPEAASYDAYNEMYLRAEAVKMRDGYDLSPNAFNPYDNVQTYDGTTALTASFTATSMDTDLTKSYDDDGDSIDDTVDYAASVPEYTDADNPTFTFEVRWIDGKNSTSSWPTTYTELDEKGTLPQSDDQDTWPITAYLPGNTELPEPTQLNNEEAYDDYEIRHKVWEAGDKADTVTYSSDTYVIRMYAPPASLVA